VKVAPLLLVLLAQSQTEPAKREPVELTKVRSWAYQLQRLEVSGSVDALAGSKYDLLVLEPTRTHKDQAGFDAKKMVERLKSGTAGDGVHRKLVLAYIDIGEAEDERWYWTWSKDWKKGDPRPADWPAFIAAHDPDGWEGDYPVAFWDEAWKDIVLHGRKHPAAGSRDFTSVLDEVIRDGFDGVYLDWVEAWENDEVSNAAKKAGKDPAKEMIAFINEIRDAGRAKNPGFLVIQQNGSSLLRGRPELLKTVDAIAQEDLWYTGDANVEWNDPKGHDRKQEADFTKGTLAALAEFQKAGKPVLTVDYTVKHAKEVYARARDLGFVPYCSRTSLEKLTTTPPPDLPEKK
jgi:cysteinyl-tRNA synthetase